MEIDKLKSTNIALEGKLKNMNNGRTGHGQNNIEDGMSEVSTVSDNSFVNHEEGILHRMRDLQFENENMKL